MVLVSEGKRRIRVRVRNFTVHPKPVRQCLVGGRNLSEETFYEVIDDVWYMKQ